MSGFRKSMSILFLIATLALFFACLAADDQPPKMPANPVAQKLMQKVEAAKAEVEAVDDSELVKLQAGSQPIRIIDVREQAEYDQGHIKNAEWFPRGTIDFDAMMGKLGDPSENYVLYCKNGPRSILAAKELKDIGYNNVKFLGGGFQGWVEAGNSVYNQHGEIKITAFEKKESDK